MPIEKTNGGYRWSGSATVHKKRSDALYEARGHYIDSSKKKPSRIRLVDKHGKPTRSRRSRR